MWLGLFEAEEEDFNGVPDDWACPKCGEDRHDYLDITADSEEYIQPVTCQSCNWKYYI